MLNGVITVTRACGGFCRDKFMGGWRMAEESWNQARLIPTSGINGADEQERRATSALLAVMSSVREFGRVLTQPLGAPAAQLETYIEVPFYLASGACIRTDFCGHGAARRNGRHSSR